MRQTDGPQAQGLYDPRNEHDACGFGFVVDIAGRPSHAIVRDALTVLVNLEHRGATGSEKNTGDGAGITIQIPHKFLADVAARSGVNLRGKGGYGVGMVFLPQDKIGRVECFRLFEQVVADEGLHFLGWRDVPTENASLGASARAAQPLIRQVFIDRPERLVEDLAFERKLYVVRRLVEKAVSRSAIPSRGDFYIPSMSCRTIVYKGMLNASQLQVFYPDLADERVESAIAMVHSRFSTNTFPSWARAHPYRYISHNGEINTLRGNVNWMHARQSLFSSKLFGDELTKALPVVDTEGSDSAMLDNVLELLYLSGRSVAHSLMMMVPEPWQHHESMPQEKQAFYEFHACLMEPWDGPASIAFTDGIRIGATLDRNGLRPARYYVTADGRVVMASEAGVLDIPAGPDRGQRPAPAGPDVLVDTAEQRIVSDEDLKRAHHHRASLPEWVRDWLVKLTELPPPPRVMSRTTRTSCAARKSSATRPRTCPSRINAMATPERTRSAPWATTGPRRPVREAPAAVLVLQAALRPGHQPAHRRHPRRDHHGHRDGHRPGGQPPGTKSGVRPSVGACRPRSCPTRSSRRSAISPLRRPRASPTGEASGRSRCRSSSPSRAAGPRSASPSSRSSTRPARPSTKATTSSSCRIAATTRRRRRSRRCSPFRRSTTTSSAPARARRWAWCWNPANRGKSITSRCSSATAPALSTRTSPSRPSTTRCRLGIIAE